MIQAMTIWGQDRYILLDSKDNGPDQCISSLICFFLLCTTMKFCSVCGLFKKLNDDM